MNSLICLETQTTRLPASASWARARVAAIASTAANTALRCIIIAMTLSLRHARYNRRLHRSDKSACSMGAATDPEQVERDHSDRPGVRRRTRRTEKRARPAIDG